MVKIKDCQSLTILLRPVFLKDMLKLEPSIYLFYFNLGLILR